jgi:hypothetical protein
MNAEFSFLKQYKNKRLLSIQTVPYWPAGSNHVSDEVVLSFSGNSQLVVNSKYDDVDMFFSEDEDVVFSIREEKSHEAFSNIEELKMTTILVDETPRSISIVYDEVSYADKSISDKTIQYPLALFIEAESRTIGIWRDVQNATWLNANYNNASIKQLFPIEDQWSDFEDVPHFTVCRKCTNQFTGETLVIDSKTF